MKYIVGVVMRTILTEHDNGEQHLDETSRLDGHQSKSFVEKGTICCSTGGCHHLIKKNILFCIHPKLIR